MGDRKATSLYLEVDHVEWMEQKNLNRSEFVNDLIGRYREGNGRMDEAVARFRLEQLESEEATVETRLDSIQSEKERLRDQLKTSQAKAKVELEEAKESLEGTPREPTNAAIQTWADELGMTPQELIEALEGGSDE